MPKMLDKRYVAGLFDGEGHLGIYPHSPRQTRGLEGQGWSRQCSMRLNYLPILYSLKYHFGGEIYHPKKRPNKEHHKQQHVWSLQRKDDIQAFLEQVTPYLHEKQAQALLFLKELSGKTKPIVACLGMQKLKQKEWRKK